MSDFGQWVHVRRCWLHCVSGKAPRKELPGLDVLSVILLAAENSRSRRKLGVIGACEVVVDTLQQWGITSS
jgi:hypothetical protein